MPIKEKCELKKKETFHNKIEKPFNREIPLNNIHNNIQTTRESSRLPEQEERKDSNKKTNLRKNLSSYDILILKNSKKNNHCVKAFYF